MKIYNIAIASDHAGYRMKEFVAGYLLSLGHSVKDLGAYSEDPVDYSDFAHPLAEEVESGRSQFGISFCGSGNGINMTLNKHLGIRAALCWNAEIAALARSHNDANVCSLPARFITDAEASAIVDAFLETGFSGDERHKRRIAKISQF